MKPTNRYNDISNNSVTPRIYEETIIDQTTYLEQPTKKRKTSQIIKEIKDKDILT